jgi:uncharacterized protein YwqG
MEAVLLPFAEKISQSLKPCLTLKYSPEPPALTGSRLGGVPYLPVSQEYPLDEKGHPRPFLGQFNFSEMPYLPGFPQTGLLQIFVQPYAYEDGCFARFLTDTKEESWKETEVEMLMKSIVWNHEPYLPVKNPGKLVFELISAPPDHTNLHFEDFFEPGLFERPDFSNLKYQEQQKALRESETLEQHLAFKKLTDAARASKLGGYGFFPQGDPRHENPELKNWQLLLETGSDENFGIVFGDCQELCLMIREADLARQDFSSLWMYLCP